MDDNHPPEMTARPSNKAERLAGRATYDISPALKNAIVKRATRLGIPASQLAHFLLLHALRDLDAGKIDPEPYLTESDSPRFRNNLDLTDLE